ncbi:MAG: hypothetical protein COA99_16765 [Moraxellaceae bacterium]|nr:MAG: hypothetical protein COA99_16765 [Moraxellaceae bacterium]
MQEQSTPYFGGDFYSTYNNASYFATFGGGHDLHGDNTILGNRGDAYSCTYGPDHSGENIIGAFCSVGSTTCYDLFDVVGLETYTFENATSASEPSSLALFGLGMIGLGFSRRRQHKG